MKRYILIIPIVVIFLLAGIAVVSNIAVKRFAKNEEEKYPNLVFVGIEKRKILLNWVKDYESEDGIEIDSYVFTPDDCLAIKEQYEDEFGVLLFLYSIELDTKMTIHDSENDYTGAYTISFEKWRPDGYKTVVFDCSRGYSLINSSYFSNCVGFDEYEIYGALLPGKRASDGVTDDALWKYACTEAKIITDESTYNEYLNVTMQFKDLLSKYGDNDIVVIEGSAREYDDRPTFH
ncbi:MAG: hypothetical protein K6G47_10020 [Clostridia bacterium]|nr:hypothetical protein [Clostridia bacterium]